MDGTGTDENHEVEQKEANAGGIGLKIVEPKEADPNSISPDF